jgi:hypothetical protein
LLSQHAQVFGPMLPKRPLDRRFEQKIEMEEGKKLVIISPYHPPRRFKDDIEREIKELLEMGHIKPNSSPFSSLVVLEGWYYEDVYRLPCIE